MLAELMKNVPFRPCAVSIRAADRLEARPSSNVIDTTVWPGASTSPSSLGCARIGLGRVLVVGALAAAAGAVTVRGRIWMPHPLASTHTTAIRASLRITLECLSDGVDDFV